MKLEKFKEIIRQYQTGILPDIQKKNVDRWFDHISEDEIPPFKSNEERLRMQAEIWAKMPVEFQQQHKNTRLIKMRRWVSAAAAIVVLGLSGSLFFRTELRNLFHLQENQPPLLTEFSTPIGKLQKLQLPDSSTIFLNGNAKVRFDSKNFKNKRQIYLDQGEAFFAVKRDSLHPFSIKVGKLGVEVLGTSFNINHSISAKQITIDVKTGRVRVDGGKPDHTYLLTAGKGLHYNETNATFQHFDSNPQYSNVWIEGGIFLNGATFEELSELLYNRYGVVLKYDTQDTKAFSYSLLIPQVQSVDQLLQMICNIHQLKFRRTQNEVTLYP
ncbi:FecR family protein [Sphingobacterium psychroaquaticum]|uniref:FecR family protein n=1 Tax=Sphingobacterium psychroaquaticum TaxID=561061 RepID=A0A1X7IBH5_9SPHI|nr:FecR family protein [Sphingobacterium psychroaquaticum]SMG11970.1 FecR family protein [Sphingobacterium psychroaquaticum]